MRGISHTYAVYSIYSVLLTTTFFQRSLHATCQCVTQMITQPINKTPDPFQKSLFLKTFLLVYTAFFVPIFTNLHMVALEFFFLY